jgi:hypothetical protein
MNGYTYGQLAATQSVPLNCPGLRQAYLSKRESRSA